MKALKVTYSRLISKGNYENAKIEIELEVEPGEKAAAVFKAAKDWVENRILFERLDNTRIERAKDILANKRNYRLGEIEDAEKLLANIDGEHIEDLPF